MKSVMVFCFVNPLAESRLKFRDRSRVVSLSYLLTLTLMW